MGHEEARFLTSSQEKCYLIFSGKIPDFFYDWSDRCQNLLFNWPNIF